MLCALKVQKGYTANDINFGCSVTEGRSERYIVDPKAKPEIHMLSAGWGLAKLWGAKQNAGLSVLAPGDFNR